MTGQELIDYIKSNNLENAVVTITATMYYNGDHDCRKTQDIFITTNTLYDCDKGKYVPAIDIYVDNNLY